VNQYAFKWFLLIQTQQVQRSDWATPSSASSICSPQPDQVAFLQISQVTFEHIKLDYYKPDFLCPKFLNPGLSHK
jgi:hypothetical protein